MEPDSEDQTDSLGCGDVPPVIAVRNEERAERDRDTVDSLPVAEEPWSYPITKEPKGLFVIFNHEVFDDSTLPQRKGTDVDKKTLTKVWKSLGFTVVSHDDLNSDKIKEKIDKYSDHAYHENYDCFGLAVLTHGDEEDQIYARDKSYDVSELFEKFRECKSLVGKPKFFFIQACRGTRLDHGHKVESDTVDAAAMSSEADENRSGDEIVIPKEADFLFAYSTVEGYYSWRDQTKGSWFIQTLSECIRKYISKWDLVTILTQVCKELSKRESCTNIRGYSKKKQCPSVISRLTGLIYLTPRSKARQDLTDHPSGPMCQEKQPSQSEADAESPLLQYKDDGLAGNEYYEIQLEILKKKKEMIELKEKLCRAKLSKVTFEI